MSVAILTAAKALANHFTEAVQKRGESFAPVFANPLLNGKPMPTIVGVPLSLLEALDTATRAEQSPIAYTRHESDEQGNHRWVTSWSAQGDKIDLLTVYAPSNSINPGTWIGFMEKRDEQGRVWTTHLGKHVQDNFGNLVRVPA